MTQDHSEIDGDGTDEDLDPFELAESAEADLPPVAAGPDPRFSATLDEPALRACVARVVRRDEAALAELYEALVGRVYAVALRVTGNLQTAEEVAEDTFWQVWREAPRFDASRGAVIAWVVTIARSRALDALRRVDRAICDPEPDSLAERSALVGDDPHDLLAASQENHRLQAALQSLEPLPRQLVSMAFFRGLTHEEIAGYMNIPLGTVKSHIRRALESMRRTLAPA